MHGLLPFRFFCEKCEIKHVSGYNLNHVSGLCCEFFNCSTILHVKKKSADNDPLLTKYKKIKKIRMCSGCNKCTIYSLLSVTIVLMQKEQTSVSPREEAYVPSQFYSKKNKTALCW